MLLNVQKVGNIINFTVSEDLLDKYNNFKPCCNDTYVYIYTIRHCFKNCTLKVQKCSFVLQKNPNQSMKIMDMVYCLVSFSLSSRWIKKKH